MPFSGPQLSGPALLNDLVDGPAKSSPQDTALVADSRSWTWEELAADVRKLAARLFESGLNQGDRVASLMPNCGELLIFYLACFKAGVIATPLNYRYTPANIDYALGFCDAQMLFVHAERQADIAECEMAGKLPKGLVSVAGDFKGARSYTELMSGPMPQVDLPTVDIDATALIFFTSGSTGNPKGVMHSITSFGSIVASFAQAMKLGGNDVVFPGGSISHVGSLSTALCALFTQSKIVLNRRSDPDALLSELRQQKPTVVVALPAALVSFLHSHETTKEDFRSVRLLISGGDKFPVDVDRKFLDLTGIPITESYGLTEAADFTLGPVDGTAKPGSVGHICPGYRASIRDDTGIEVSEGALWLSGAPLCQGYWNNPGENAACFSDGWFDTGDVLAVDADGFLWFKGRTKQIIVHDGSNIAPQEVEEAVMLHPAIDMAGAVGVHNKLHGENVWAYVTLKAGAANPSPKSIIDVARREIGYKAPEAIIFLDQMPLNATGKVDRMALKKMAADRIGAHHEDRSGA